MSEREIFFAALELDGDARAAYLKEACEGDEALREGVERLLREHERSEVFMLDQPLRRPHSGDRAMTSFAPGDSLSYYEILGLLGAGGMGTVYLARDSRLGREVAIKVLPEEMADDGERLRRFEREAKTLASLNHPNVAGIHGVDQEGDVCFLALELVPGEDLAERLSRGPLSLDESLDLCRQIAEGLEAAHEAGVVHRDLKPANVRVTPDGVAKVLDFGLAKPLHAKASAEGVAAAESDSFLMTEEGLVLGTPTYMSPEQARGKPVDRRTDLWAFGCVFFECLTGRRAFGGDTMTDVLAAVVGEDPDWELLPPLPPRVHELLRRALAKNPRERLRDAGEARVQLELAQAERSRAVPVTASQTMTPSRTRWGPAGLVIGALALGLGYGLRLATEGEAGDAAAVAAAPMCVILGDTEEEVSDLELSPDGKLLAWTQPSGVFIRAFDSFEVIEVTPADTEPGFETPHRLAWSPDGSQLAFTTAKGLWRVDADGKHLTLVTREGLSLDSHAQLDWSRDGQLVFSDGASRDLFGRSFLVERTTPLFSGDEETTLHFDGVHVLPDESLLVVRHRVGIAMPDTLSLWRDGELRDVLQLPGWNLAGPVFSDGVLVFERKDTKPSSIWSVTMDLEAGSIVGDPRRVVDNGQHVTVAGGTLAYVVPEASMGMRPAWIDLQGEMELLANVAAAESQIPTLSHDGQRVFTFDAPTGGPVWAHDAVTGQSSQAGMVSQGTAVIGDLQDGRLLAVQVMKGMPTETLAVGRSGASEVICQGVVMGVSRDGRMGLVLRAEAGEGGPAEPEMSVDLVDFAGGAQPLDLGLDPGVGPPLSFGSISPDNRWAVIPEHRQGRPRLVLTSTSGDSLRSIAVSDGGVSPAFSESGETIYFWTTEGPSMSMPAPLGVELWQVSWQPEPELKVGTPERLFRLEDPVMVTGFDPKRSRFLGAWKKTAGRHRILARTAWGSSSER